MAANPLISIITVNLNNLEGLKRTMASVFNQTYQNFEYLIIDGGSSDGSKEYIEANADKISYWVSEPDKGIYNGMNKGIKKAQGEYLLFLNSGDHFVEQKVLEENHHFLNDSPIIYFDVLVRYKGDEYIKYTPTELSYDFLKSDSLPHQSTFIKNTCFSQIGYYDEKYKIISDWKFIATARLKNRVPSKKVPVILTIFYKDGISTKEENLLHSERKEVLEKEFPEFIRLAVLEEFYEKVQSSKLIRILRKLGIVNWL